MVIRALAGLTLTTVIGVVLVSGTAEAQSSIPHASLSVTVQQNEEGKINQGFHILELTCWEGACSLSTISLNQCGPSGSGQPAFYPKVQSSTTWSGNLKLHNEGDTLVVEETGRDIGGDYVNKLRFTYDRPRDGGIVRRLVGFSGGLVKNSVILKRTLTIQYVPLPRAHQVVTLDCGALLPGVDK